MKKNNNNVVQKNQVVENKGVENKGVIQLNIENEEVYNIKGETLIATINSLNIMQSLIKVPCIQVEPIIVKIAQDINNNN